MRKKLLIFTVFLLLLVSAAVWYFRSVRNNAAMQFARQLGNGINIGNSLDCKDVRKYKTDPTPEVFETFWNNPVLSAGLFRTIADLGIRTVRIPVSWGEHLDENDRVDPEWMARVREVTEYGLDAGLYVILDLHHEAWLIPEGKQEAEVTKRFASLWKQIAEAFADKDEHLLFESMNEPRLVGTDVEWTAGTREAREIVNRLNGLFVKTVRNSGGNNANRWLLLPAYCTGGEREALEALELPKDKRILVAVHAYYPYSFTLDENGTSRWSSKNEKDTRKLDRLMHDLTTLFLIRKVPVVITEYSCEDKDNLNDRIAWTDYYLEKANGLGIPCMWWDNGKTSRLINRESYEWTEPLIVSSILTANHRYFPAG